MPAALEIAALVVPRVSAWWPTPAAMHIRPLRGRKEVACVNHGAQGGCREETPE